MAWATTQAVDLPGDDPGDDLEMLQQTQPPCSTATRPAPSAVTQEGLGLADGR